jgi:hypothetical protein
VPIVPVVSAGAHDGWYVFTRGERIARLLGLKRLFRLEVFPIAIAFPTGLIFGTGWPYLPLSRKILIEVLEPIVLSGDPESKSDLRKNYLLVTSRMQDALDRLVAELPRSKGSSSRKSP